MRTIIFYKTENGDCPVEDFLDSLPAKQAKKVVWVLDIVESMDLVPASYFKKLDGTNDIWEVRADLGNDAFRLLGFMHRGNFVVLTNGFAKKTKKAPLAEIELAERRKKDYLSRGDKHE